MELIINVRVNLHKLGAQIKKTQRQLEMSEKLFCETIVSFPQAAHCIRVLTNDMRKLISTQSERQQQIDQIVGKAKFDQSLDDDFIFDDEEIDKPHSPEHQLEEPMKSIDKDIGHDAFSNVTVAESPTNRTATLDFPSNDYLQEEHSINENIHNSEAVVHEIKCTSDYDKVTVENIQYEPQDIT